MTITVTCNGETKQLAETMTLAQALSSWDYQPGTFAVALNFKVVPQSRYQQTHLQAGDTIEIVQAAVGG